MSSWSHLPNAVYIDRIVASVKANSVEWDQAYKISENLKLSHITGWSPAYELCQTPDLHWIWHDVWSHLAFDSYNSSEVSAWQAITALIAWNDCGYMVDSDPGELAILAKFGTPAAILLLAACIAISKINNSK